LSTNKIQPPPKLARILKDPSVAELDHFLLLLWQLVRNLDATTVSSLSALSAQIADLAETDTTSLVTHALDTSTHRVTEILGAGEVQTVTNKDIRQTYATTAVATSPVTTILKVTAVCNITLPTAVGVTGKELTIDNDHAGVTTIFPADGELIGGSAFQALNGQGAMVLYSDGVGWRIKAS